MSHYEDEIQVTIEKMRRRIMAEIDYSKAITDGEIYRLIDEEILFSNDPMVKYMPTDSRIVVRQALFNSLRRLDVLQPLIEDPAVTEIMVNGPYDIFYERAGVICPLDESFSSKEKLADIIQQIVGESNRVVNTTNPIVDCRLSNGDRVNVVLPRSL